MRKAIIVDIDGTLAIRGNRSPFEWMKVKLDSINKTVVEIVRLLRPNYHVIIFSGRDEVCRELTKEWLHESGIAYDDLYMRPKGDMRKDSIVKKELYEQNVYGNYEVAFVLDDRNQVVDMWRNELGLICLQVAEGNF